MDADALLQWAEEHHGLLRDDEFRASGASRKRREFAEASEFERLSPRVLRRRGAPKTLHQEVLAAALDAGSGIVLAGLSDGWLWGLPGFEFVRPVELTRERSTSKTRRDLLGIVRERRWLPPHHVTEVAGIPTLTLPVLLYQLAGMLHPQRFERVADTVVGRSPAVLRAMHDLLPELGARGRNGVAIVRAYLGERPPGTWVPTGLERKFERIFEDAGERPPRRQVDLGGHEWIGRVDYYDDSGVIVEVQSKTFHESVSDKASDRARAAALVEAGFAGVLQVPEERVWYRSADVLKAVRLARQAVRSPDPTAFVVSIRALGVHFETTKREARGAGRMGA